MPTTEVAQQNPIAEQTAPDTGITLVGLAARIRAAHAACLTTMRTGLDHALTVGRLLIEARDEVEHGKWTAFVGTTCELSMRTAQAYMQLAKGAVRIGSVCGPLLPILENPVAALKSDIERANAQPVAHLGVRAALALVAKPRQPELPVNVLGSDEAEAGRLPRCPHGYPQANCEGGCCPHGKLPHRCIACSGKGNTLPAVSRKPTMLPSVLRHLERARQPEPAKPMGQQRPTPNPFQKSENNDYIDIALHNIEGGVRDIERNPRALSPARVEILGALWDRISDVLERYGNEGGLAADTADTLEPAAMDGREPTS